MARDGKVVFGRYLNSIVSADNSGQIVIHAFPRNRKLTNDTVARWEFVGVEHHKRNWRAARFAGRVLDSVVTTAISGTPWMSTTGASMRGEFYTVKVDWVDGMKSTVVRLPQQLFELFQVNLKDRRAAQAAPPVLGPGVPPPAPSAPPGLEVPTRASVASPPPSFSPPKPVAPTSAPTSLQHAPQPDVIEQIARLAVLRDQGVLSEEEFSVKKAELLARL